MPDKRGEVVPDPFPFFGMVGYYPPPIGYGVAVGGKQMSIDRPEFVELGALETGLPLKETRPKVAQAAGPERHASLSMAR
jgi:hypothetical protein